MRPTNHAHLRVFVIGSGAIGTYIGGSLASHGNDVVFLERPHRVPTLQERGISITVDEQTRDHPQPYVVGSLEEAFAREPYHVAIFALKSYHTAEMAAQLEAFGDQVPPILCLQNGVGNESILAQRLGMRKVIPGTITTSVTQVRTGEVSVRKKRGVGLSAGFHLSDQLVGAFSDAGLNPKLYTNPHRMKWTKLLTNLMANATCAILDMTPGEVYSDPDLYALEINQLREALSVIKALDLQPVNLPGIPSKTLSWVVNQWPPPLSQPILSRVIQGGRGGKMPSFHSDLHRGKDRNEVEHLNGAVDRFGDKLGVPTPVNALLTATTLQLVEGDLPLEAFSHQPQRLLDQLP